MALLIEQCVPYAAPMCPSFTPPFLPAASSNPYLLNPLLPFLSAVVVLRPPSRQKFLRPTSSVRPCDLRGASSPCPLGSAGSGEESLVAVVGNYDPESALKKELQKFTEDVNKDTSPLPIQPTAVGGYIAGPPEKRGAEGTLINHTCYGLSGCSGSPLIHHPTGRAIGVFQGTETQIHYALSSESIHDLLKTWLRRKKIQCNNNEDIQTTTDRFVNLL